MGSACSVCERDCPAFAIKIVEVDGKRRPQFDLNKCIFCNQCVESCPRGAIKGSDIYELATVDKKSLVIKPNPNGDEGAKQ
jgi:formate hydrogenlyase subunit 6/NADH:ubiquinone oxidoreductase subunit I